MDFVRLLHEGRACWARLETETEVTLLSAAPWDDPQDVLTKEIHALLPPAAPSKIVCIGRNYAAHAAELGNEVPKAPLLFLKPPSALLPPGGDVLLPPQSERVEHEAELALVIGRRSSPTAPHPAPIFGYTIANDVTARDIQRADVQFTRGKGFDTFCPLGPKLVTGVDPSDLRIHLEVDGETRQDGRTSSMIHDAAAIVAYIAAHMTLEPGDLVLTGTPAGVGPLRPGDEVRITIDEVGSLVHGVQALHT